MLDQFWKEVENSPSVKAIKFLDEMSPRDIEALTKCKKCGDNCLCK